MKRLLVGLEKIEAGDEGERLRNLLQRQTGQTVTALMAGEIGGGNGLVPVTWAARMGLPVVDADGMGRAFPLVSQAREATVRGSVSQAIRIGEATAGPAGNPVPAARLGARPDHGAGQRDRRRGLG
jgi:DUF917 family protein